MIEQGNKLGRTIGYPTANLQPQIEDKLIPGNGVYAVYAEIKTEDDGGSKYLPPSRLSPLPYKGMMNIGTRPTVDGSKRVIEVNIFDFDADIYGQVIRVAVKKYLRSEVKFNGLEELKMQLHKDKEESLKVL